MGGGKYSLYLDDKDDRCTFRGCNWRFNCTKILGFVQTKSIKKIKPVFVRV